jgi:predicted ester cyclase
MSMSDTEALPFTLPPRPRVRRIRKVEGDETQPVGRAQPMAGFEPRFTDIVDYIVRITDEIWQDRAIGYIRETYDPACTVYSSYGVVRSAEAVVQSTIGGIAAVPDGETHHLNVAWSGDEAQGFYTAHLGFGGGTNRVAVPYVPATGRRYAMRFAADCISRANMIHTEWLVRDNGACVRQLGFDLDEAARAVAEAPQGETFVQSPGHGLPVVVSHAPGTVEAWAQALFDGVWNDRRLDRLGRFYAPDAIIHSGGGRTLQGLSALSTLIVQILASIPDGRMEIGHVCWSDETDGTIVAVRWTLTGSSAKGGILGNEWPAGRQVFMMGSTHLRLSGPLVVEEWTVFDEVAVLAMAYRD